jgi:hypothetical protein
MLVLYGTFPVIRHRESAKATTATMPTLKRLPLGDNQAMRGERRTVLMVVSAGLIISISVWFADRVRNRRKAAEREAGYQIVLARYASDLKPGMKREQVERYLQTNRAQFGQMCCVAGFRGEYVDYRGAGWDDLVKIGEESAPFFCGENNVYIAFEFNPKSHGERSDANPSDVLKKVSVFHELERCL